MSPSLWLWSESPDAARLRGIGRPNALFGIAKRQALDQSCPDGRKLEMYQQPNVNETLPSQGESINKLLAEHHKASLQTAKRILRSKEDSEDAVQTAYCAA